MLPRLNSLWIGEQLGYLEKLTLASALSVGHSFALYSYAAEKLRGVPTGVEVRDANEVAPYQTLAHYFDGGSAALGTDFFRYAMQAKGLGAWVDLDLYFIRPIDFEDEYVFGWEHRTSINGAVLRLPANSDMVRELCDIPHGELAAAFLWAEKDGDVLLEEADRRRHSAGELPVGHIRTDVPDLSGEEIRCCEAEQRSAPSFIRSPITNWKLLCGPPEFVKAELTKETRTVHLWRSILIRKTGAAPPPGSYLEALCHAHALTAADPIGDQDRIANILRQRAISISPSCGASTGCSGRVQGG